MTEAPLTAAVALPGAVGLPEGALSTKTPSFEEVYQQCFSVVWRNLRRLGVPAAGIDDAVQEVFLVVHRRLGEFEGRSSMKTWVLRIALRVASDTRRQIRRKSPHARGDGDAIDPDAVADESALGADERMERAEGSALLHRLLDELDEDKRAVFVLAELEQMTSPEIAESLGVNVNTVSSRLRAARQEFEQGVGRERARDARRAR